MGAARRSPRARTLGPSASWRTSRNQSCREGTGLPGTGNSVHKGHEVRAKGPEGLVASPGMWDMKKLDTDLEGLWVMLRGPDFTTGVTDSS